MLADTAEDRRHLWFSVALTLGSAIAFYGPALRATGGDWPAPLDDVLIHFDFARAAAEGHPFEWIAGQGYSSGETSPLYPFVLAVGYLAGFRGLWLGAWAAIVACVSLVVVMRSLRTLVAPSPWWVSWLGAAMAVCVGVLDWTWFSGMEVALLGAILARALCAARRARDAPPTTRRRAQWICGLWGALLVATRPESAVLVAVFAVIVLRRAGAQSALGAMARVAAPGAVVTLAVLLANKALTGDTMSAGAVLKLLSGNPFLTDVGRAREVLINVVTLHYKVTRAQLSVFPALWPLFPLLALAGLARRQTRALTLGCITGALGWALLVSWNGAARYQNFRYYMPALALVLFAGALGLAALAKSRRLAPLGAALGIAAIALALPRWKNQIAFFRDASANVHDQQIEVGRRIALGTPPGARVLVGDAGAIPYASRRHAIDALGLGGYLRMPFARAAQHGEAATMELIERLPPEERPAYLALYPNWFPAITRTFGREIDRVVLTNNVICGGTTKAIYVADWSALGARDPLGPGDALDVADVLSEEEHGYVSPAPEGGWTRLDVKLVERVPRFDAGRIIPEGQRESFVVQRGTELPATITVRTDAVRGDVDVEITRRGTLVARARFLAEPAAPGQWVLLRAALGKAIAPGDRVAILATRGEYRDFHVWIDSCCAGGVGARGVP